MQVQKKTQIPPTVPLQNAAFSTPWHLWYHHELDNWKISGYRKIFTINTISDFWDLHNNIEYIGGINNQNFFLMRDGVEPIWEDPKNRNGGCWSIKLSDIYSLLIFIKSFIGFKSVILLSVKSKYSKFFRFSMPSNMVIF